MQGLKLDRRRTQLLDCIFLFVLAFVSALPYLRGLEYYSDDWTTMSVFARYAHDGLSVMLRQFLAIDSDMLVRPVQLAVLLGEFKLFGPHHAILYHIVITGILALTLVILYLTANELGLGRRLAFTIALVFGSLPHYSTDKFWIASQQAILCVGFACIGIYALQKAIRESSKNKILWAVLAAAAVILSILSYEVALGLIVAGTAYAAWRVRRDSEKSSGQRRRGAIFIITVMSIIATLVLVKARLQTRVNYPHHFLRWFELIGGLIWHQMVQTALFNCWTYGLHMPAVLLAMYRQNALDFSTLVVSVLVAIAVTSYLWKSFPPTIPNPRTYWLLFAAGFGVFWLGAILFAWNAHADFSTAGIDNRITVASALGAACVEVAVVGLGCSMLRSEIRTRTLAVGLGLVCGLNCLVTSGIGWFWKDAAVRQAAILNSVSNHVPSLPQGSVLLLDGFCRYSGPGVVFETDWDATGAIGLTIHDFTLHSDVVSRNLSVDEDAISTTIYGSVEGRYPYGPNMFVYNVQKAALVPLPSKQAAEEYFALMNPSRDSGCPPGQEGVGTKVF